MVRFLVRAVGAVEEAVANAGVKDTARARGTALLWWCGQGKRKKEEESDDVGYKMQAIHTGESGRVPQIIRGIYH